MITFTEDQLLQMLKQRMGISTSTCGVEIVTQQGTDIDSTLRLRLQARYLDLLYTADVGLIPVSDIAIQAASLSTVSEGVCIIHLPDSVLRPTKVKLPEWPYAVTRFVEAGTPEAEQIRLNPYSRSTARPRIAIQDNTLWLYETAAQSRPVFEQFDVIMQPVNGNYTFDPRLLDIITDPEINLFDKN